jgi:flagellar motility protein MotE (MotC chaperone)
VNHAKPLISMLAVGMIAVVTFATQPPAERPRSRDNARPGDAQPPAPRTPATKEELKARLQRRLDELDAQRERIKKLEASLERGEELAPLEREIRESGGGRAYMGEGNPMMRGGGGMEDRRSLVQFLKENNPDLATRLESFHAKHRLGSVFIDRLGPRGSDLGRAKKDDPVGYELRLNELSGAMTLFERGDALVTLVKQGKADTDDAKTARVEMRKAVEAQFDTRAQLQAREIETLSERLEKLRKEFQDRRANREAAIDGWMEEIIKRMTNVPTRDPSGRPSRRPEGPADAPATPSTPPK